MDGAYNGTQGSVARPTSRTRVVANLDDVWKQVFHSQSYGMTWKELGDAMHLHHGQASGALSNLHRLGRAFVVRDLKRENCQVYVSDYWKMAFHKLERIDEPVQTRASRKKVLQEAIIHAATRVVETHGAPIDLLLLEETINNYKKETT
jgi:hypothetical protein